MSCIIPVRDGARYLGEAIQSVLAQTDPPREILVIDDGSTDDTPRVVQTFGAAVTYLEQANLGVSAARNRGVRQAGGDLLCFLDADDRLHPDKLRQQGALLQQRPDVEFCDAITRYFWSEELSEAELRNDYRHAHAFWQAEIAGHISSWLVRRSAFDRIGVFDEQLRFSEDTDWRLRFQDCGGEVETLPQILSFRRLHPLNITARDRHGQVHGLAVAFQRSRARRAGP